MTLGATTGLEQGASFVISGLSIPNDASVVTPEAAISLLKCIRSWRKNGSALPNYFMSRIATKWVKTTAGYRHPNDCLLFDSMFTSLVHRKDGPFIDEAFYGQEVLASYQNELETLGVIVNARAGCALMAQHLKSLFNVDAISRIYSYLEAFRWKPHNVNDNWIWIPEGSDKGQWVKPASCVLYDSSSLFSSQLHVLAKWYDDKLLTFFNMAFSVKHDPAFGDYCKLWSMWQRTSSTLTHEDCSAFWEFIGKHWSTEMGKLACM